MFAFFGWFSSWPGADPRGSGAKNDQIPGQSDNHRRGLFTFTGSRSPGSVPARPGSRNRSAAEPPARSVANIKKWKLKSRFRLRVTVLVPGSFCPVPGRCPFILTFYQYNRTTNRSGHRRPGAAYSWPLVPFAMRFLISRFICASCCAGDQWRPVSYSSAAASFLLI